MFERYLKPEQLDFRQGMTISIEDALPWFRQTYKKEDVSTLENAIEDGFTHILRLPKANAEKLAQRYGPYFDKTADYHDFIRQLSQDFCGYESFHVIDSYHLFRSEKDAERVLQTLQAYQKDGTLPISLDIGQEEDSPDILM